MVSKYQQYLYILFKKNKSKNKKKSHEDSQQNVSWIQGAKK